MTERTLGNADDIPLEESRNTNINDSRTNKSDNKSDNLVESSNIRDNNHNFHMEVI